MLKEKILNLKKELADDLCIMGHHYQSDEVMQYVDKVGDSLELARMIEHIHAKHIIFAGVNFMAEGSVLLAKEGQYVHIPDMKADCVMAQMVPAPLLDIVLKKLNSNNNIVIPIAYVNTPLAVKAVVGKYGGAVCTSANAKNMLEWALNTAKKEAEKQQKQASVLFLPDANLAENTAHLLNIDPAKCVRLNIQKKGEFIEDFIKNQDNEGKIFLWPGCCAVHARLRQEDMLSMREKYPDAKIVLHPECSPKIVKMADYAGSTSFIIKLAKDLPNNSTLIIGTEVNLVNRLAKEHANRIKILPLKNIACSNMAKITEEKLYLKLLEIKENKAIPFPIDTTLKENALLSLQRMLNAC